MLHIWALHIPGNNNPTGIDVKSPREAIRSTPTTRSRTASRRAVRVVLRRLRVLRPNYLGHPDNYIPANPLQTPAHIVPEWYFLPFYANLRAIPSKLFGVAGLIGSIAILFFVPWLDTSRVRSTRYRPIYKWFFWAFVVTCFVLGYLGSQPPEGAYLVLGPLHRLLFPVLPRGDAGGRLDRKAEGTAGSITESVLGPQEAKPARRSARRNAVRRSRWHEDASALRTRACRRSRHRASRRALLSLRMKPSQQAEASSHAPEIESQDWTFTGPFGAYDNAQPARLRRLQECLRGLPFHAASVLPQSRRAWRTRFLAGSRRDARRRSAGDRRSERQGRDVPAPWASVGQVPLALRERRVGTANRGALPQTSR